MSRNAFYRMEKLTNGTQVDRKTIGKWSELVGIGRKSDEFALIDFEFRWRSQGGPQSRAAPRAVFSNHNIMLYSRLVIKKVASAKILFAMTNNPQALRISGI